MIDYDRWPSFTAKELQCQHCGKDNPNPEFIELMDDVQDLRNKLGFPFPITSGYRCPDHPLEVNKESLGQHSIAAVDIGVSYHKAEELLGAAYASGKFNGKGVNQKGSANKRFIHLDNREHKALWSY